MNFFEKLFDNYPILHSTQAIAGSKKGLQLAQTTVLRPSVFSKIIASVFLIFATGCWLLLLRLLLQGTLVPVVVGLMLFVSFIIGLLVWNTFLNPVYLFTIKISTANIELKGQIFPWQQIAGTYVLRRMNNRRRDSSLVIITNDGKLSKHSLFKFGTTNERLAAIIEFYKTKE